MTSKQNRIPMKNEIKFALNDIMKKYPAIVPSNIELFIPIYYPIAIIEMDLFEETFEDFEFIQLTVLKLIGLGQSDVHVIADLLGLSPNYVHKMKLLLEGYRHVKNDKITELGRKSLEQEKKIIESQVRQKFQLDALNGRLIKMDKIVADNTLNDKDETHFAVGHLDYLDGMYRDRIVDQIENHTDFMKQKSSILHSNILQINEVRCNTIKYAQCFMLKTHGDKEPVIFSKRYDDSKGTMGERFSWLPFSVWDKGIIKKLGLENETPLSTELAIQYMESTYDHIGKRSRQVDLEKQTIYAMKGLYPFKTEDISIGEVSGNRIIVYIDQGMLEKYTGWLYELIKVLGSHGEYIITSQYLYGKIVSIRTKNERFLDLCKEANEIGFTREEYKRLNTDRPIVDELERVIRKSRQETW